MIQNKSYSNYQTWLVEELRARKAANPSYSLRSFARFLGVGAATLSDVLNYKRTLSYRNALKIAEKLLLSPRETQEFLDSVAKSKNDSPPPTPYPMTEIPEDVFRLISDWHYFALIQLAQTKDWDGTASKAAYRLSLTESEVKIALNRLERLGYFAKEDEKYRLIEKNLIKTTHGIPSSAIRKAHKQYLKLAEKSLESTPIDERNFATLTIAIDPRRLKEADAEIQNFKNRMRQLMQDGELQEVYTLAIQLFPISRPQRETPTSEHSNDQNSH